MSVSSDSQSHLLAACALVGAAALDSFRGTEVPGA